MYEIIVAKVDGEETGEQNQRGNPGSQGGDRSRKSIIIHVYWQPDCRAGY